MEEDVDSKVKQYFDKHTHALPLRLKNCKEMSDEKKQFVQTSKLD